VRDPRATNVTPAQAEAQVTFPQGSADVLSFDIRPATREGAAGAPSAAHPGCTVSWVPAFAGMTPAGATRRRSDMRWARAVQSGNVV
jgi:hypothetical protein